MNLLAPGTNFASLIASVIGLINATIPVLIAAALVFTFIGIVKYIRSRGEADNRTMIVWSLIALFVIVSVWGILHIMCATFIGNASCSAGTNYNADTGIYDTSGPPANGGVYPI